MLNTCSHCCLACTAFSWCFICGAPCLSNFYSDGPDYPMSIRVNFYNSSKLERSMEYLLSYFSITISPTDAFRKVVIHLRLGKSRAKAWLIQTFHQSSTISSMWVISRNVKHPFDFFSMQLHFLEVL